MGCENKKNLQNCPCTYQGCPRKGICCACLPHHLSKKQLPACCFSKETEKTYDRSFEKFIEENKK
jgi:hypothetical protein